MTNTKAQEAIALLRTEFNAPQEKPPPPYILSVRFPADLAHRLFSLYEHAMFNAEPLGLSRNSIVIAVVEAGLEAIETALQQEKTSC